MASKKNLSNKRLAKKLERIASSLEKMNSRLERRDRIFSFFAGASITLVVVFFACMSATGLLS